MTPIEAATVPGPAPVAPQQDTPPRVQTLPIRFTGSGSEYFRIWIVNLLLTLVTFSLYWPFARARRIAYFQNNTLVGDDPLGFHGDPWKMFRGYIVVMVLAIAYGALSETVPAVAAVLLLLFALVWPALWRASLQFRLRNTSWRGVRMAFVGDLKGAYGALLPFFVPALVLVLFLPDVASDEKPSPEASRRVLWVLGAVAVYTLAVLPWCFARLKRYQHGSYLFAGERTELRAGNGRFYGLLARVIGLLLLVVALVIGVVALIAYSGGPGARMLGFFAAIGVMYLLMPLIVVPYATVALQNLVWANTRTRHTRFRSELRFGTLFRLTLVNWLLIVCTLGLYWPFAQVRTARARLECMALQVKGDVDSWMARAQVRQGGVLGDAAGDFFGIDVGL
ncbi:YjgN family protein [Hydrogenophaga crocea]|uniref:DUF898 domain-containing protein n=1 Tax=Hydrogenophaga crocea TaxID=2716225 RepID=A0A6G8IDF5_9BURK|nr:YjgN family protein [Hydrogenophaga crocea]QIM51217.1 DUF898 domain-containing protein [Hydrogenophaga crocea]